MPASFSVACTGPIAGIARSNGAVQGLRLEVRALRPRAMVLLAVQSNWPL